MKVYYLAVDPATPIDRRPRSGLMQGREIAIDEEEFLGDGPTSSRVAVVDRSEEGGTPHPGAKLLTEGPQRSMATHWVENKSDITARDFQQVSVFGAVHATMDLFETPGVLGRKLTWAFDHPQITVIPRAGEKANAAYERESKSLKFYFFDGVIGGEETTVFTCLSPDIVAHETGHAILDGIVPDLYDATAPQSLGLHEAIADITAMLFASRSARLRNLVLEQNRGVLRKSGAFNAIAEQFGRARSGRIQPLRDLLNDKKMTDVPSVTPHAVSEVLTGTLYEMFLQSYETELDEAVAKTGDTPENRFSTSGRILASVSSRFARIAFRALDYLPPGEVSFADYIRAVVSADTASNPESPQERDFLIAEAVRREILLSPEDAAPLACTLDLGSVDLQSLLEDDETAAIFAENHRKVLLIPSDAKFDVRPRLDVTKQTIRRGNVPRSTRELIFKVTWARQELVVDAAGLPLPIEVRHGSTLVIDWEAKTLRALLTTNPDARSTNDRVSHGAMRRTWLSMMLREGGLRVSDDAKRLQDGSFRFSGVARQLHISGR